MKRKEARKISECEVGSPKTDRALSVSPAKTGLTPDKKKHSSDSSPSPSDEPE